MDLGDPSSFKNDEQQLFILEELLHQVLDGTGDESQTVNGEILDGSASSYVGIGVASVAPEGVNSDIASDNASQLRFNPTDEDLLYCLRRKLKNQSLPPCPIVHVELYEESPHDSLVERHPLDYDQLYCFTSRTRKYKNGSWPKQDAGNGYGKATGGDKPIHSAKGELIGNRKTLVYYVGKFPDGEKLDCLMQEYVLADQSRRQRESEDDMKLDDWVLCRIYKNRRLRVHQNHTNPRKPATVPEDDDEEVESSAPPPMQDGSKAQAEVATHHQNPLPSTPPYCEAGKCFKAAATSNYQFNHDHHLQTHAPPQIIIFSVPKPPADLGHLSLFRNVMPSEYCNDRVLEFPSDKTNPLPRDYAGEFPQRRRPGHFNCGS